MKHRTIPIVIRLEDPDDYDDVRRVNEIAFGQPAEANLVDLLRTSAKPQISLVAVADDQLVGHIFFSPVTVVSSGESFTAMGLAPMSVLPEYQRLGIGSRLVREGLKRCAAIDQAVVVVLGHAEYYSRLGFIPAHLKGLRCEYDVADDVFMVLELRDDALAGRYGLVKYLPAFNEV